MANFTVDNWIAIAAILVPIILGWLGSFHIWLWSIFRKYVLNKKIKVVTPTLDKRISSLNRQVRACPFLDGSGRISVDSLLKNHQALLQDTEVNSGCFRTADVYIKCYKLRDETGGTRLVTNHESVTNLVPSVEVELTLSDIIEDWNSKVAKVRGYDQKEKVEFVSRFHVYFEMIHPFLDGNGRIGRALLEEQLSFLFNQTVKFSPDMKSYYNGIELAARGDESDLRKLILDQVNMNSRHHGVAT